MSSMDFYRTIMALPLIAAMCGVVGCSSVSQDMNIEVADAITQIGTRGENAEGYVAVTNLITYGNHGIGSFDFDNSQLIIVSGEVYRADADHQISQPGESGDTPYAVITWFDSDRMFDVASMKGKLFERALDMRRGLLVPQAIQVDGFFKHVTLESYKSKKTLKNMTGVLIGYYYPEILSAHHDSGYHLYFIDRDRKVGGRVSNFEIGKARISIDQSAYLHTILPMTRVEPAISRPIDPKTIR